LPYETINAAFVYKLRSIAVKEKGRRQGLRWEHLSKGEENTDLSINLDIRTFSNIPLLTLFENFILLV